MNRTRNLVLLWIFLLILGAGILTACGTTHFTNLSTTDLEVTDDLTVTDDVTIGGTLTVATLVTETTDLSLTGDLTVADVATIAGMSASYITGTVSGTIPDWTVSDDLTVTDEATVAGLTTGYITGTVSGTIPDWTVSDDLTVTDDAVVGGLLRISGQTAISCTNGGYITPTGSYQPLESAGNVGLSSIAIGTAGDLLVMVNTANTTITITDTGTTMLGGNRALSQYDSLVLWCDGTNWIELSFTNN